ncbi:hypothetical protein OH687_10445 [Burkholderia anthina]|nr:hypothetical protein OH687_10445 [Burkholderia anthina]
MTACEHRPHGNDCRCAVIIRNECVSSTGFSTVCRLLPWFPVGMNRKGIDFFIQRKLC